MKKVLKFILLFYAFSTIKAQVPPGVSDSTFYYRPDGTQEWFYYQRDVAVFRYNGGVQYTGTLPAFAISVKWHSDDPNGYNLLIWDSSATNAQIDITNLYLAGDPLFEYGFIPCTRNKNACASAKQWIMGSDLINVRFKSSTVSPAVLSSFLANNGLALYQRPDTTLPNADTWTWIFRLLEFDRFRPYDACARIWNANQSLISHCEPDMATYKQSSCTLPSEITDWNSSTDPDALWWIKNNGNTVYATLGSGVAGADTKICECWGAGYTGSGIKVAVIDGGGYDYTHPDMVGQYLPGYDFVNNTAFSTSHYVNDYDAHGMVVASAIAAHANSGMIPVQTHNTTAVGAAYDCQILPYIVNVSATNFIFNTQVTSAIQKAVVDGADIVNMSFEYAATQTQYAATSVYQEILAAVSTGRSGKGTVFVAAVGNDNSDGLHWPAAMDAVIGVGATDPNDYRGAWTQANMWTWSNNPNEKGSNYWTLNGTGSNPRYDVMAPGTLITAAYTQNPITAPHQNFTPATGTSLSAPIIAGIAALILQRTPSLSYSQVASVINSTADKIRSGTSGSTPYDYSQYSTMPGYATETFYGRVNCANAIVDETVGVKENKKNSSKLSMFYLNDQEVEIFLDGTNTKGYTLDIYDISGRQVSSQKIEAGKNTYPVNTNSFVKGVYLFNVVSSDNNSGKAFKYIK